MHGIKRRSSSFNTARIDHIYEDFHKEDARFFLHYGDMTDTLNLVSLLQKIEPDEVYNLAAQSHVKVSWDCPEFTADTNAMGTLRLLESLRVTGLDKTTRFYQASTSELYGKIQEKIQNEKTPFYPRSPYGVAKLYGYWITVNYRESFGMFASNGILFNHESPRRGETFVTRKITMAAARIKVGLQEKLYLGNLNSKRDWGHARDYVEGMWRILQHEKPDDFVLATGRTTSIRDFVKMTFKHLDMDIEFKGKGVNEKGIDKKTGKVVVEVDPRYFRPAEVDVLLGDASKAKKLLKWKPKTSLENLCKEMVESDFDLAKREKLLKDNGYKIVPVAED